MTGRDWPLRVLVWARKLVNSTVLEAQNLLFLEIMQYVHAEIFALTTNLFLFSSTRWRIIICIINSSRYLVIVDFRVNYIGSSKDSNIFKQKSILKKNVPELLLELPNPLIDFNEGRLGVSFRLPTSKGDHFG